MTSHRFGRFRFELATHELFRDGEPAPLQRRTAELLELLLERAPALVPRDELFARLWPDGFVEDGNLFQHVYTLRRALAADPSVRVETVRGRGYRLAFAPPAERRRRGPPPRPLRARGACRRWGSSRGSQPRRRRCWSCWRARRTCAPGGAASRPIALAEPAATAYRLGIYAFQRRTPAGFVKARAYFRRTVALAPRAPEGYAGLALLVGNERLGGRGRSVRSVRVRRDARASSARAGRIGDGARRARLRRAAPRRGAAARARGARPRGSHRARRTRRHTSGAASRCCTRAT